MMRYVLPLLVIASLMGNKSLVAQVAEWGEEGELVKTYTLGGMETDTGRTVFYLEYREKPPKKQDSRPLQLIFLKNRRASLSQSLRVKGMSKPHGPALGEGLSLQKISGPDPVSQVLYQGKSGVPQLSNPQNDHPWNVQFDAEAKQLSFRWEDHQGYYAEWAWDDSLLVFLPAAFTEFTIPWTADSSARLHRRIFSEVPVDLLEKVHGVRPPNFPPNWSASGQCMVRTRVWDDFYSDELHGFFNIRYTSGKLAPEKPAGEAVTVDVEGTWMEGDIPYGPFRLEAWFDDGTIVRAMLRYADFQDREHATGTVLWANISCIVQEKGESKAYSLYLDEVRDPSLPMLLRELRSGLGAVIPSLFVPERQ